MLDGDPAPLPKRGRSPQFSAHVYCGQTAEWIKMALGMDVGLGPGHIVLDEDPAPLPKRGQSPNFGPFLLWPNGCMYHDSTWYGGRPQRRQHCVRWDRCGQTARRTKKPLDMQVGFAPGDFVFNADPAPSPQKKGHSRHPIFGPCLL